METREKVGGVSLRISLDIEAFVILSLNASSNPHRVTFNCVFLGTNFPGGLTDETEWFLERFWVTC